MTNSVMIEADSLGRYFGNIKAVDGVSFSVNKGDVLGFLGPNGAGKSTTMKMLTCFLTPTFGTARVCGFDIVTQSRQVRKSIGYLPENAPLYGEMTVKDFLKFVAEVRGFRGADANKAIGRVVEIASLGGVISQRIETLSKGFMRRVGLAQALIHDPSVLILDEPTDGLDPNQKHDVRKLINMMAADKCIVLSTHILEEVDAVCNRAIVISKGQIVADSTPESLRKKSRVHGAVTMRFGQQVPDNIESILKGLGTVKEVEVKTEADGAFRVTAFPYDDKSLLGQVVNEAENRRWPIEDLRLERGELDEVFRSITQ